jgi:hypothetical protein
VRVLGGELSKGLVAGDHCCAESPSGGLAEVLGKKFIKQPVKIGEQLPVVSQEAAQNPGDRPDELSMGQAQKQIVAEVLPRQQGALLSAWGQKEKILAGEGSENVVAAVRAVNSGDTLAPIAAKAECGCFAGDEGEAEPAESAGITLL